MRYVVYYCIRKLACIDSKIEIKESVRIVGALNVSTFVLVMRCLHFGTRMSNTWDLVNVYCKMCTFNIAI